jgi:hypothetical protein
MLHSYTLCTIRNDSDRAGGEQSHTQALTPSCQQPRPPLVRVASANGKARLYTPSHKLIWLDSNNIT